MSLLLFARSMGYVRIYRSPGGARRLAMPELDSGAIDKGSDGRGRSPHAEGGQRDAKPPMRRAHKRDAAMVSPVGN